MRIPLAVQVRLRPTLGQTVYCPPAPLSKAWLLNEMPVPSPVDEQYIVLPSPSKLTVAASAVSRWGLPHWFNDLLVLNAERWARE